MRSHIIQIITLALALAFSSSAMAAGDASDEKAAFKVAYQAYQAAVEAGDADATVAAAEEALELGRSVYPDDSPSLAALHVNFGNALLEVRKLKEAIEALKEGIKRYEVLYGKDDELLIDPLRGLLDARHARDRRRYLVPLATRILRLVQKYHGKKSIPYADASIEVGKAYYFSAILGQRERAHIYLRKALKIYSSVYDQPADKVGIAIFWLGKAAEMNRRRDKAEEYYIEALDIFEKTSPSGHELELLAHTHLIKLYEGRGESDEATLHCQAISRLRPLAGVEGYKPLYRRPAVYPQNALVARRSGYIEVNFTVTATGIVANATVVESQGGKGKEFEHAALEAVSGFRYAPAVQDGELVSTEGVRAKFFFGKVVN